MDGAGAPVRPPLTGAETQAGGRQYWASGVCGLGVPRVETDGGGPKARRRILRLDGPADRAGPVPEGGKTRLPPRRKASSGIFRECTVAVEGYYYKLCKVVVEPYK